MCIVPKHKCRDRSASIPRGYFLESRFFRRFNIAENIVISTIISLRLIVKFMLGVVTFM